MSKIITRVLGITLAMLALSAQAQQPRFLSLTPPEGLPIIPLMEGWIANPDGSYSISFGFINRNDVAVDIPLGENNRIEPAEFHGDQPTHFPPGRGNGVFTVTLPPDRTDEDVWWYIVSGDGEELKVPGRTGVGAYELDFIRPRPQGSLQPHASFGEEDDDLAVGLFAQIQDYPRSVSVGEEVELALTAYDPAERDPTDPRFGEPLDMGVTFIKHQGPGEVTFTRNEKSPAPENPYDEDDPRFDRFRTPEPSDASIGGPRGTAYVNASFSAAGQYLIRGKVDVHDAPDSSNGDQCCWTNVYQRITVTP